MAAIRLLSWSALSAVVAAIASPIEAKRIRVEAHLLSALRVNIDFMENYAAIRKAWF